MGVVQIAQRVGREKSQVSRALKTLADFGFVERDPQTLAYRLGWRVFTMASRAGERRLTEVAPRALAALVRTLAETVHLSILQGTQVVTLFSELPPHAVHGASLIGRTVPAHCTSSGRALLFDHSRDDLEGLFAATEFGRHGPKSPSSVDELHDRLCRDVARGYAIVDEEFEAGHVGVAAPVRNFEGRIVATLNVSGPKFRLGKKVDRVGKEVRAASEAVSSALGAPAERRTNS